VAEIAIATVNRVAVALENAQVSDGDRVELFPPVGGG
jgi:molybdopterin converting factor small subunit